MPHGPDPDGTAPYEPAAERGLAHYAEQALLGALLLDPGLLSQTTSLSPDLLEHPAHQAVLAAVLRVPAPANGTPLAGAEWLRAVEAEARTRVRGLTTVYLHQLISACPRTGHVGAYASMVRSEHARRTLRLGAGLLARAAGDATVPDRARHVLATADALTRELDGLASRFPPHAGSLPRTQVPPPPVPDNADEALDEEQLLLASAIATPAAGEIRWLTPDDFTHPPFGGLWQCVTALIRRGEPVDPLTVLWEATSRGVPGIVPSDVLALLSDPFGDPHYWGTRVVERALLLRARHTAAQITACTDNPATTGHQLITVSRRALADLTSLRHRWEAAVRPAAARAGPRHPSPFTSPTTSPPSTRSPAGRTL
ncbi:DnaB-like helicase N-terminal domain-containing protein [Streptomyces sp. NPDC093249]|uniref:DnaB-like helicase N-terminal domain-containing protein n=1 Tax=unclassified Streptomyces TaxID=2593676 RepID=UPI003450F11A